MVLGLSALLSCTTSPAPADKWPSIAYSGFTEKIDRIIGDGGINCGLLDRVDVKSKSSLGRTIAGAQKCVDHAISEKKPFKIGSFRSATTSYLYEVVALSNIGEYWIILFDRAMDESENLHFVRRCTSLRVDLNTAEFLGDGCSDVPTDEWLADII